MAIAFDAAVVQNDNSTTEQTIAHTCTGSNLLLLVGFITNNATDIITGVTYNSVAMTRLDAQQGDDSSFYSYVYGLLGPATGANNVVVSASGTSLIWTCVTSYTGVAQSGLPDSSNSAVNNTASSWTINTTTVADNCWVYCHNRGSDMTYSSPDTARCTSNQSHSGDSNAAITPAGSYTINGTCAADVTHQTMIALSFAPATAAGPANLKSYNTNLKANIKSIDTNLIANIKSIDTNV